MAYNQLSALGPVPAGSLAQLEMLDVGANPLSGWEELLHLSQLPRWGARGEGGVSCMTCTNLTYNIIHIMKYI